MATTQVLIGVPVKGSKLHWQVFFFFFWKVRWQHVKSTGISSRCVSRLTLFIVSFYFEAPSQFFRRFRNYLLCVCILSRFRIEQFHCCRRSSLIFQISTLCVLCYRVSFVSLLTLTVVACKAFYHHHLRYGRKTHTLMCSPSHSLRFAGQSSHHHLTNILLV